jgi:hypothetical protein
MEGMLMLIFLIMIVLSGIRSPKAQLSRFYFSCFETVSILRFTYISAFPRNQEYPKEIEINTNKI